MSLDNQLGFTKNPFSKKSSEQELDFLEDIFFEPNYYKTLMDVLANGDSRFIIGQRGHGKSSIINKLLDDLECENLFIIKIDRFDNIPIKHNEKALIRLIITSLVTKISIYLEKNPKLLKNLGSIEKENLAQCIRIFFNTLSKVEYDSIYDNVLKIKTKNFFRRLFNRMGIGVANTATSAVVSITSTIIRQSLGLPEASIEEVYKNYFGKVAEIDYGKIDFEVLDYPKIKLKQTLDDVLQIINKVGFEKTVVLIDKIDEYQELNQDINKITSFASDILSDTELLLNNKIAIGFSLWSELKSELAGIVRFDKFGTIDVRWKPADLTPLINKRLKYFSENDPITLEGLIQHENDRVELIKVANKSPRDLISAMAEIYKVQANKNINSNIFELDSISEGMIIFCEGYDYDSITPSKSGKNKEIKAMINRLLRVRLKRFSIKQLTNTFKQNNTQSEGQIKLMRQYKLIREDDILGENNEKYFEVIDPKVEYLIRRGVTQIE